MNADTLNKSLLENIRLKLPNGITLAKVLMETLSLSKEATYRRLRGEVPLSLYEAAVLTKKLNISLNPIIETTLSENSMFELKAQHFYNLRNLDYKMLYEYLDTLIYAASEPYSEQVFTYNIFPQLPSHKYYMLAKYNSFRWLYINQDSSNVMKPFHEMEYPDELFKVSKEIVDATMNIKSTCYIWDSMIFYYIIKEINYFSNIHLINKEDVLKLKEELFALLKYTEDIAITGRFKTGNKVQIYISSFNSDTSYCYLDTENLHVSMIGAFAPNYAIALDQNTLLRIKNRIHSLKRISNLISESGEMQRIQFFKEQRKMVEML